MASRGRWQGPVAVLRQRWPRQHRWCAASPGTPADGAGREPLDQPVDRSAPFMPAFSHAIDRT